MLGVEGAMHAEYVRMQECLVQRELCMLNTLGMPGAEGAMHAEYAEMQGCVVQREQCMLNVLECRNTSCGGSNAC